MIIHRETLQRVANETHILQEYIATRVKWCFMMTANLTNNCKVLRIDKFNEAIHGDHTHTTHLYVVSPF